LEDEVSELKEQVVDNLNSVFKAINDRRKFWFRIYLTFFSLGSTILIIGKFLDWRKVNKNRFEIEVERDLRSLTQGINIIIKKLNKKHNNAAK
jgi:hypothetical protein